ncbi:siderophore iron transporter mirA [Rhexocercosporidium sp. MPI-PUGE-AT-0058]|nr:siderophore iron transporter mirA [Rhexocercosporidium sp. MPI-PUGE-AT-0058]
MSDTIDKTAAADTAAHEKATPAVAFVDVPLVEYNVSASTLPKIWSRRALYIAFTCLFLMNLFITFATYTQNHFGRPLGFAIAASLLSLANVLYASCNKIDIFLSGGIFEALGDSWWNITQQIFIADITSFINRGILFTLPESFSAIPTLYPGSYLGEHMLLNSSWRWGYGIWAVILPFCALPTIALMIWTDRRATKMGIVKEKISLLHDAPSGASWGKKAYQVLWIEVDLPGEFLLMAGLAMTLLLISIAGKSNTARWKRPSSVILLIMGVLTVAGFLVWDGKFAKKPIIPFRMVKEKSVVLGCVAAITIAMSDAVYRTFLSSSLQVAGGYSPGNATRIDNAQRVAYNVGAILAGISLKFGKNTKPFIILGSFTIVLANGLPIYLTNMHSTSIGNEVSFITVKTILGVGHGFVQVPIQVALQASVPHSEVGIATAVYLSSLGFGSNMGNSIGGAIWNGILPSKLRKYLPVEAKAATRAIFGSIVTAKKFKAGSATQVAINLAYRETQRSLSIASFSLSIPLLIIIITIFMRNVKLAEEDKVRDEAAAEELKLAEKIGRDEA